MVAVTPAERPVAGPAGAAIRLPVRPVVRRWARALVDELLPLCRAAFPAVARPDPHAGPPGRRLLAIFVDGLSAAELARAGHDGTMRFLSALRDDRTMVEARCFSGMPSSTASFQAGLFYGLAAPDIPAFTWLDRRSGRLVRMNDPRAAAAVEARLQAAAGTEGLLSDGGGYLTILRGGAPGHFSTAAAASILDGSWRPSPSPVPVRALASIHAQTAVSVAARLAAEPLVHLWDAARFARWAGARRHEANFLANRVLVGNLAKEAAQGEALLDLLRGVPRVLLVLHDYDEVAHRRGPVAARRVLRGIDASVEALCAVAGALPDPPDLWIFSDHGQIAAVPFERLFGCSLASWLRGARDGARPAPRLPAEVAQLLGVTGEPVPRPEPAARVVDAGNYAHVYLGSEPLDAGQVARLAPALLARALDCPGIGLVALRHRGGALAFHGGRRVDPTEPATLPAGATGRGIAALLEELARSPSAGDLVLYGAWFPGGCVAFSWEFSSHGGPSPQETETFVLHPAHVTAPVSRIAHGADLHRLLRSLYG